MSLWKWFFGLPTHPSLSPDEQKVVQRLLERMDQLEKQDSKREIEWTMWYDKFRTLFMRLSKRAERLADEQPDTPQSPQDAPQSTIPQVGYGHAPLTRKRSLRGF